MRKEIYEDLTASDPNFDATYTDVVPLDRIVYDKKNSQVRQAGHATNNVQSYANTMKEHGPKQLPPASVKCLPNGKYEIKDGNTRTLAAEKIQGELFISWYHDQVVKPANNDEWEDLQVEFNDHPKSEPNSDKDLKNYLARQQQSGAMQQKVGFTYIGNESKYIDGAIAHYRKKLPNSGKDKAWWERAVKGALKGHIATSYETYTKPQLFNFFKQTQGFAGDKVGEISGGEVVFPFTTLDHWNPNVLGSIAAKVMANPGVKYNLVFCLGSMAGKDDVKLGAERKKIQDLVVAANAYYASVGWDLHLYIAPQIKNGPNKEPMYQLTKVV